MRKTFTNTLMLAATLLALSGTAALSRSLGETPGTFGGGGRDTTGPSTPSAPQSNADGPDTRAIEMARKTQNPGFCARNASDYYVRAGLAVCENY